MNETLLFTIIILVSLGVVAALVLYFVAQKFKVYEDPRIDEVEGMLPGANCGGCGFAGCRQLACALVEQEDISQLYCPVGGGDVMKACAGHLGKAAAEKDPMVAVIRCNGNYCSRPHTNVYNSAHSCAVEASFYGGETACSFGCLGKGDCTLVCNFNAIHMNSDTGLPEVDADKCTACGACVKACPKMVIELRKKGIKDRRIFVSCISKDKGAITRKACSVGCIGCGKCVKVCPFEAITMENNLAYIDFAKCKLCRKCVSECPTGAIWEVGFPAKKAESAQVDAEVKSDVTAKTQVDAEAKSDVTAKTQVDAEAKSDVTAKTQVDAEVKSDVTAKTQVAAEVKSETVKSED